jgi:hypothetical protein
MKKLEDIPKKNDFKVPENYFENLEAKIAERIETEKPVEKVSAFDIFKPYIYMAACVLILAFGLKGILGIVVKKPVQPIIEAPLAETISDEEYYENMISEISSDDLTLYEYINEDNEDLNSEIINSDEDLAYVEDYLSQYYLEYELLYE